MATLKLKPPAARPPTDSRRTPLRGSGVRPRPTLAQAQEQRAEREARYQEQLRQRYGDTPPGPAPRGPGPRTAPAPVGAPRPERRPPAARTPDEPARGRPRAQPTRAHESGPAPAGAPRPERRPPAAHTPDEPARGRPRAQPVRAHEPAPRGVRPGSPQVAPMAPPRAPRRARHEPDDDEPAAHAPGSLRLSKRMSELGIASRREADEWIARGWVRVDDQVVSALGSRVLPSQRITVDAKAKHQQAQRVTVLLNKPVGYVSGQAEDGYEPAVVLVTPDHQWREDRSGTRFLREHLHSLVPAGRLDIDSVGLLVLTQDGRVAKQLIGEDSAVEKEYLVRVAAPAGQRLDAAGLARLRHGLELDGEALRPAQVEWVNDDQLRFVLTQGKKRQIRRMCEAVGLQVLGLKRVRIGQVMLGDLPPGCWRYLRADERFE